MSFYLLFWTINSICLTDINTASLASAAETKIKHVGARDEGQIWQIVKREIPNLDQDRTHLLLVGPEASTSACSLGKKPCWYLP